MTGRSCPCMQCRLGEVLDRVRDYLDRHPRAPNDRSIIAIEGKWWDGAQAWASKRLGRHVELGPIWYRPEQTTIGVFSVPWSTARR